MTMLLLQPFPDSTYAIWIMEGGKMQGERLTGKLTQAMEFVEPWVRTSANVKIVNLGNGVIEFEWLGSPALVI